MAITVDRLAGGDSHLADAETTGIIACREGVASTRLHHGRQQISTLSLTLTGLA